DLLARRPRALGEQLSQDVAGLRTAPPILADLRNKVRPQLRVTDPRPEVVGRVETGIHVGEMTVGVVTHAGRLGKEACIALARRFRRVEVGPELELELQL